MLITQVGDYCDPKADSGNGEVIMGCINNAIACVVLDKNCTITGTGCVCNSILAVADQVCEKVNEGP